MVEQNVTVDLDLSDGFLFGMMYGFAYGASVDGGCQNPDDCGYDPDTGTCAVEGCDGPP